MPLESYFEKEKINVKSLAIEEPEKKPELTFDPEKEIAKEDWERYKERLNWTRENNVWREFVHSAADMKLLFPDRISELNLGGTDWQGMKKMLEEFRKPSAVARGAFLLVAEDMKFLFPQRIKELNITEDIWQENVNWALNLYDQRFGGGSIRWQQFAESAKNLKMIFPERASELHLDETAWRGMMGRLKEFQEKTAKNSSVPEVEFIELAANMRILMPERFNEVSGVVKTRWQEIKSYWEKIQRKPPDMTVNMKILAAEEVKITDKGLEIIMQKPKKDEFKTETPPLPEIRKF